MTSVRFPSTYPKCVRCREDNDRPKQAYCRRCHRDYERQRRKRYVSIPYEMLNFSQRAWVKRQKTGRKRTTELPSC